MRTIQVMGCFKFNQTYFPYLLLKTPACAYHSIVKNNAQSIIPNTFPQIYQYVNVAPNNL